METNLNQIRSGIQYLEPPQRYTGMIVTSGFGRSEHLWELYGLKQSHNQDEKTCDISQVPPMRLFGLAWTFLCLACRTTLAQGKIYFRGKSYRKDQLIEEPNN